MNANDRANAALLQELTLCETAVWTALCNGDRDADARFLHADFLGVYPDGFAGKADHVAQLDQGATLASFTLDDLRLMPLGADHALLSYRATFLRVGGTTSEIMYVSSVWQREKTCWINVFSQDTPSGASRA